MHTPLAPAKTRPLVIAILCMAGCSTRPNARDTSSCPETPPASTAADASRAPAPWALTRVLDGPFAELETVVLGRIAPLPEECGDDPDRPPTDATITIVSRVETEGPLLEAVSLRYPGDIACAPIEYCALALRSAAGWWLTPHDDNAWCQGVTGPSSRIEIEYEDLDAPSGEPGLLVHHGIRRRHTREYVESFDGNREESWSTTEEHFEHRCQITSDARAYCQR